MHPESFLAFGIAILIPVAALATAYLFRRLSSKERLLAIEKGAQLPFESLDPRERAARSRRSGIVLIAVGLGIILACAAIAWSENERDALSGAALGIIPLLIGAGLLLDYRLRVRELQAPER